MRKAAKLAALHAAGEAGWATLRYLDNRRKGKPLQPPWDYVWAMCVYGVINGHVPLLDIERAFRSGTPYAYRGHRHLDPQVMGVDLTRFGRRKRFPVPPPRGDEP